MATQTLAESAKFVNNQIIQGVVESIITVNPIYDILPFTSYTGQSLKINIENTMGDAGFYAIGDTITHKGSATTISKYYEATKLIGDVEIDGLVEAVAVSAGDSVLAREIISKAKNISRQFQNGMINGSGTLPQMNSLQSMVTVGQTIEAGTDGNPLTFTLLDELRFKVLAKDNEVDYFMMNSKTLLKYKQMLRDAGVNTSDNYMTFDTGRKVSMYENIPIFVNDYLPNDETQGANDDCSSIYAGVFDDGTGKIGLAGLHPESMPAGMETKFIGASANKDEEIYRLRWYANVMLGNNLGLARLKGIR